MRKRIYGSIALTAASIMVLAACSSSSSHAGSSGGTSNNGSTASLSVPGSMGTLPPAASGAETAGTITWAEQPGATPTWIFPITQSGQNSVFNLFTFSWEMWRPTYWTVNGVTSEVDPSMSLADLPVYSDNDQTVSITFKSSYKWSDGTPITADDLLFDIDMIKAGVKASPADWSGYTPGNFPDNLASTSEPNPQTLVLHLTKPVNPTFFTDDILGQGPTNPLPVQTWAKDSVNGPMITDWKTNPADALKIYNFLIAQNKSTSTYATNPLWQTVDGPYKLSAYNATTGGYTLTPNTTYGGPHATKESTFQALPYTSDAAEFNAIKAGAVDVAQVPLEDAPQINQVKLLGYNYFGEADYGMNFAVYNFKDKTGDFDAIANQLYFRQAMEHLEDETGWIKAFFNGYGSQAYGPVPQYPVSPDTPADAESNPFPFSVADATALLKANGWTINAGGTDVCSDAGTGSGQCGAGIPAGTKLAFNYIYSTAPALIGQQATDLVSQALKAGIHITLQASNFDYMLQNYVDPGAPANENKWALEDFGGESDDPYATTFGLFNTTGLDQLGDYSNPTADSLINASVSGGNPAAVKDEASFLTTNLPAMFQPNSDLIWAWKTDVSGTPASFENLTQYYATPEFWYFTK
jgi:peptide/nickel transport system substrate-binding protein